VSESGGVEPSLRCFALRHGRLRPNNFSCPSGAVDDPLQMMDIVSSDS